MGIFPEIWDFYISRNLTCSYLAGVRNLKGRNIRPFPINLEDLWYQGKIRVCYIQLDYPLLKQKTNVDEDNKTTHLLFNPGCDALNTT